MEPFSLPVRTADDAARVVRALGKHRYVGGRVIAIHALCADLGDDSELSRWARGVLADESIDAASRDERLYRASSEDDLANVLLAYWGEDASARDRLAERLAKLDLADSGAEPFDERVEEDIHPLLVDAGWELLPLASLDAERHKGAIAAYGDPLWFESARFEEDNAIPKIAHLQELPALGPAELLRGSREGKIEEELILWTSGDPVYQDYVLRGVLKVSKLA